MRHNSHSAVCTSNTYEHQMDAKTIGKIHVAIEADDFEFLNNILKKEVQKNGLLRCMSQSSIGLLLSDFPITKINNSIFMVAVQKSASKIISKCIDRGIDLNIQNGLGQTALNLCMEYINYPESKDKEKFQSTAALLVKNGAGVWVFKSTAKHCWYEGDYKHLNYELKTFTDLDSCEKYMKQR